MIFLSNPAELYSIIIFRFNTILFLKNQSLTVPKFHYKEINTKTKPKFKLTT